MGLLILSPQGEAQGQPGVKRRLRSGTLGHPSSECENPEGMR